MLRRVIGPDWIVGPGIDDARASTRSWAADRRAPATTCTCGRSTPTPTSSCAWSSGSRPSSPTARRYLLELLGRPVGSAPWRRSPAPRPVTPPRSAEGEVGPRQPCPCGSGKRYKACHGAPTAAPRRLRRPPVRGPARRVRHRRDARAGAGRDRAADASRARGPHRRALLAAADGGAGDGPRQRRDLARAAGPAQLRRPLARPRAPCSTAALDAAEPGVIGLTDAARRRPAAAGPGRRATPSTSPCTTASTSGSPTSRTSDDARRRPRAGQRAPRRRPPG